MKAHFLVIADESSKSDGTKSALDELGLVEGEDYLLISANVAEAQQVFVGPNWVSAIDATSLIVLTSIFSPGINVGLAIYFAEEIKRLNPAARVYLRTMFGFPPQRLNVVFNGQIRKDFQPHKTLQDMVRREFGLV